MYISATKSKECIHLSMWPFFGRLASSFVSSMWVQAVHFALLRLLLCSSLVIHFLPLVTLHTLDLLLLLLLQFGVGARLPLPHAEKKALRVVRQVCHSPFPHGPLHVRARQDDG